MKNLMKVGFSFLLMLFSACAPTTNHQNAGQSPLADASSKQCESGQNECLCATGSYCLAMGAMCINPTSACPASCGPGQHECRCATGSYCLDMGAMCTNPSSACPTTH